MKRFQWLRPKRNGCLPIDQRNMYPVTELSLKLEIYHFSLFQIELNNRYFKQLFCILSKRNEKVFFIVILFVRQKINFQDIDVPRMFIVHLISLRYDINQMF